MILVVAGCVAQAEGAEILSRAPYVDIGARAADLSPAAGIAGPRDARQAWRSDRQWTSCWSKKFDFLPEAARTFAGVCAFLDDPGRLRSLLQLLRRKPYTRGAELSAAWPLPSSLKPAFF